LREVSKSRSPVPVEVFSQAFFRANPVPSVFESLQTVNGVRPQNNCNICETGDIHINGLEGAYSMVLIDGMPIVGGLSTVYGLMGIPQSLIERVEIVKGPASTLYGSEAVGGIINVITKSPISAPRYFAEFYTNDWGEFNTDMAYKTRLKGLGNMLTSVNYYTFQNTIDRNGDGFTDLTLKDRISVFNKISFTRKSNKDFSLAGRFLYEDRWGGELNWGAPFRGGDSVYGESIFTKRWELFGNYALPTKQNLRLQFSSNWHDQNSVYGNTLFIGTQNIHFVQLLHQRELNPKNNLLTGLAYRYTFYDDNTIATESTINGVVENQESRTHLPGAFFQLETEITPNKMVLTGLRYDYNSIHGSILTPRINYKWNSPDKKNIFRASVGNGYRVANVFTEDHAALTGAREVEFIEELRPEKSWNANLNLEKKIIIGGDKLLRLDASTWLTYFTNKIIADYETDPNKIIYDNLGGYAISNGLSISADLDLLNGFNANLGFTLMDVYDVEQNVKTRQLLTEQFSGVWTISYAFSKSKVKIDYTGSVYSPMRLPLLGDLDPRSPNSPWFTIQNIRINKVLKQFNLFASVQNLLNFTPDANSIARSFDPFDRNVQTNPNGDVISTVSNPYALTFDPSYVFASNQGRRFTIGLNYTLLN
jgi:outer membrane receptor for ferrienterochelin and colicins